MERVGIVLESLMLWLAMSGVAPDVAYSATAVATCESGNTVTFGTHSWRARSVTADGGAFQFNDATWQLMGYAHTADRAHPNTQINAFVALWNDARGSRNWSASQRCWQSWITPDGIPVDANHYNAFAQQYIEIQHNERIRNGYSTRYRPI
jgi:hypothetical protein